MRRREFIAGLTGAAAWPLAALALKPALPVVGILSGATFEATNVLLAWVYQGLADQGYVKDRNFTVQLRWADDNYDRLPALAADLVRARVDLIITFTTPGALAAKAATQTIPIVFHVGTDAVEAGLVPSLARPGGNLTAGMENEASAAWLKPPRRPSTLPARGLAPAALHPGCEEDL
jgi:putative tryptophan/tyrosine transport system substrate-binding protein